jgi:hypothetical protein
MEYLGHAVSPGLSKARGLKRRPLALHPLPTSTPIY